LRRCVASPAENRLRQKAEFASRIKLIWVVQSSLEKYHFCFSEIYGISLAIPPGRIAVVTNVGAGCGGRDGVVHA
jgi:hypothetical protein